MSAEGKRWQRVERVFKATLDLAPAERPSFLRDACSGDSDLRREVESLLDAHGTAGRFMEQPAIEGLDASAGVQFAEDVQAPTVRSLSSHNPALKPRDWIGPYEILTTLGAGAMGEVYRARDTTLDRDVALKVLPERFAADPERLARFTREARVLASLNHPHIGAIYGIEKAAIVGGAPVRALVLELVEGTTLADGLLRSRRPLRVDEALRIATQVAQALEAAHEKAIIHRDLKPANIKITPAGGVKVLDFGLAKLDPDRSGEPHEGDAQALSNSPTFSVDGTKDGILIGTVSYMSPEQVRGQAVDTRADIWAFGCVVYEMLAGERPFGGDTAIETLATILGTEPDWNRLPAATPQAIRRLLRRCLKKDRNQRLQHIGDARIELEDVERGAEGDVPAVPKPPRYRQRIILTSAVVLVALIAMGLAIRSIRLETPSPEMRVEITTPPMGVAEHFAISPDGQTLAFVATVEARPSLWLRSLASGNARPVAAASKETQPFWSADSLSIGFVSAGELRRLDISSGAVHTLAATAAIGEHGAWNRTGTILFTRDLAGPLFRMSAAGGAPVRVTPAVLAAEYPAFLPDDGHFLYTNVSAQNKGVYVARLDGSEARRLLDADRAVFHEPSRHLLFLRNGTLSAQPFDSTRLELTGRPFVIGERVTGLSVSAAGPIAFRTGSGGLSLQMIWFDRFGRELRKVGDASVALASPSMSPDGRQIAGFLFEEYSPTGRLDIWLLDLDRVGLTRLTLADARSNMNPIWSPDGRRVVFLSRGSGDAADLYQKRATGEGPEEPLLVSPDDKSPQDWSLDGRFLLYENTDPKTSGRKWQELWALPLDGSRKPFPVVQSPFRNQNGQFSPDSKWIAYESDESGRSEIYLQPFPGPGPKIAISIAGGAQVRWRRDGKELFYIALDERLMAVPIRLPAGNESVQVGTPVALFATHVGGAVSSPLPQQYVVAPDGQRFLMTTAIGQGPATPITLILNWQAKP